MRIGRKDAGKWEFHNGKVGVSWQESQGFVCVSVGDYNELIIKGLNTIVRDTKIVNFLNKQEAHDSSSEPRVTIGTIGTAVFTLPCCGWGDARLW